MYQKKYLKQLWLKLLKLDKRVCVDPIFEK